VPTASTQPAQAEARGERMTPRVQKAPTRVSRAIALSLPLLILLGLVLFVLYIPFRIFRAWAISLGESGTPSDISLVGKLWWRVMLLVVGGATILAFLEGSPEAGGRLVGSAIGFYVCELPILLWACARASKALKRRHALRAANLAAAAPSAAASVPAAEPHQQRPRQSHSPSSIQRFSTSVKHNPVPWAISFAALLAAFIVTCALFIVLARDKKGSASLPAGSAPSAIGPARNQADSELTGLVRKVSPAVALLEVRDAKDQVVSAGTGFWVSKDGKLVTNLHVLQKGVSVYVKSSGALIRDATFDMLGAIDFGWPAKGVLGYDTDWDLAVVQFDVSPNNILELGEANGVEIGARILVIGNPQGLEGTVSEGIVSAKRAAGGTAPLLQITAPISPGSSGSPVFSASGKVVGVASAYVKLKGSQGLNFAVPAEAVSAILSKCANATPVSLAAIATAESSTPRQGQPPKAIIAPPQHTTKPVAEIPKTQPDGGSGFTAPPEDIRHAEEINKVETALFNWLLNQGLKPAIIAHIKRDSVTKWPRWGDVLRKLTGAKEKEELKRLLSARFSFSANPDQDLAISGLSMTMLASAPPAPVRQPKKVQSLYDAIAPHWDAERADTLRIEAIADPLQRQFETAKAFPEAPLNWTMLADMLLERRRIKEARQYYEKAISVGPGEPAAWLGAAKTAEALKDPKRAQECRARYKELVRR